MTEIVIPAIFLLICVLGLAKKRRRRIRLLKGSVNKGLALSTLAADTAIGGNFADTVEERCLALSTELTWMLASPQEGPIVVGLAHSDYTDAEIEEYLENAGSWSEGDLVQQEITKRKIRMVGTFNGGAGYDIILNDGKPVKTPLKWILTTGDTLKVWAYNRSGGALTTGSQVKVTGHVWLKPT